jgi:hypothetical protein
MRSRPPSQNLHRITPIPSAQPLIRIRLGNQLTFRKLKLEPCWSSQRMKTKINKGDIYFYESLMQPTVLAGKRHQLLIRREGHLIDRRALADLPARYWIALLCLGSA